MNTHQYNKHPGTFKAQKKCFVYFCLFLSVDFVNILPKSGGEQTLIELDPPTVTPQMIRLYEPVRGMGVSDMTIYNFKLVC